MTPVYLSACQELRHNLEIEADLDYFVGTSGNTRPQWGLSGRKATVGPMYLRVEDGWHCFYLDAGLLFWVEGREPDEDDDLIEDENYVDSYERLRVRESRVTRVEMRDSVLVVTFENGARVVLKNGPR